MSGWRIGRHCDGSLKERCLAPSALNAPLDFSIFLAHAWSPGNAAVSTPRVLESRGPAMRRVRLSAAEARRTTLAAQGFDRPRPAGVPNKRQMRNVIDRLGLLQLDFVNVLLPAHQMVMFSRLGPYYLERMHELVYQSPDFIEHWAHEACIVPSASWPLLQYRREDYRPWPNSRIMKMRGKRAYLETALEHVRTNGRTIAADLPPLAAPKGKPGDWERSLPRWALDVHFGRGALSVADRLPSFQRVYDVPETVVPTGHFKQRLSREEQQRRLLDKAGAALGVATLHDLADYYRMSPQVARPRVSELEEAGVLQPVTVEGWDVPTWLHREARIPRRIEAAALLSPFDPVVWFRPRGERLFDFHYRIEIYVPAAKRRWGYYVLPFLLDDQVVARVDLKADRKAGELLVQASHCEPHAAPDRVCEALSVELQTLARWLELDRVTVRRKGALAPELSRHCKRRDS